MEPNKEIKCCDNCLDYDGAIPLCQNNKCHCHASPTPKWEEGLTHILNHHGMGIYTGRVELFDFIHSTVIPEVRKQLYLELIEACSGREIDAGIIRLYAKDDGLSLE